MQKFNIVFLLILLCYTLLITACSKKIRKNSSKLLEFELTETGKLLIDKKWEEISVQVKQTDLDSTQTKNITNQFFKTDLDDIIIFSEDGTYVFDEGGSKARKESQQIYQNGDWRIEGKNLMLFTAKSKTQYLIQQLSPTLLVLKLPVENENYYYILTYRTT